MRLFHIATVADWEAARVSGSYTTSTRGRTLAEEGFIHASRGDQWQDVRRRWYADVTEPLVLLVIDPDRLGSPVVDGSVPGSTETFPHVYGPIEADAVVRTVPLEPSGPGAALPATPSFSRLYLEEMFRNVTRASVVLAPVVIGTLLGLAVHDEWGPLIGAVLGLLLGMVVVRRRFRDRPVGAQ